MTEQQNIGMISGLRIGQCWRDRTRPIIFRVVTIDPVISMVEIEDPSGLFESDTIEHFLSTYLAEAS
jgi:hypothetical protein